MTFWRRAFVVAAVVWAILLPVATLAASHPHGASPASASILAVYWIASTLCHQRPARSFHLWSGQMPVCARCTGIYVGAAVASLAAGLLSPLRTGAAAASRASRSHERLALFAAAVPTALTLAYQWTTGDTPGNWTRAVAGAPIGVVVAWIILKIN